MQYPTHSTLETRLKKEKIIIDSINSINNFEIQNSEILIEFQSNVIGEAENEQLNAVLDKIISDSLEIKNIYIFLPENFEHFIAAFVSTLYLIKQSLGCESILYGKDRNKRTYELIQLAYSGLLSPSKEAFFQIVTYDKDKHKEWSNDSHNGNKDKYSISSKNLPIIPINKLNNQSLFETNISAYLAGSSLTGKSYKELSKSFYSLFGSSKRNNTINYYCLHYFKLITDTFVVNNKFDYRSIFLSFFDELEALSVINILILNIIIDEVYLKAELVNLYNKRIQEKDNKAPERKNHSEVIYSYYKENEDLRNEFINAFLIPQLNFVKEITKGLHELAKNIAEHSTNHRGVLTVRRSYKVEVELLKNNQASIWNPYLKSLPEDDFIISNGKIPYLDISIIDDGKEGIIEKSIEELKKAEEGYIDKQEKIRYIPKEIARLDLITVNNNIQEQSRLLYNMYFNPNLENTLLSRQNQLRSKSLGLQIFTNFIHKNRGIFNVNTPEYNEEARGIIEMTGFYSSLAVENLSFKKSCSKNILGTVYNITIPLLKKKFVNTTKLKETSLSNNRPVNEVIPDSLLKNMLLFNPNWESVPDYAVRYDKAENIITNKITSILGNSDKALITVVKYDKPIDTTEFIRYIDDVNSERKAVIVDNIETEVLEEFLNEKKSKQEKFSEPESIIFFYIRHNENDSKLFVFAGQAISECKRINTLVSRVHSNMYEPISFFQDIKESKENGFKDFSLENNNLLFGNQIIRFDILKKENENKCFSPAVTDLQERLERDVDDHKGLDGGEEKGIGYNWKNTHLKIGSRLHLSDFVYGKRMFQKHYESIRFAFTIAQDFFVKVLNNPHKDDTPTNYTFIGYGFYSELMVSRIKDFVEYLFDEHSKLIRSKLKGSKINYSIVKDEDNIEFVHFFKNEEKRFDESKKGEEKVKEKIVIVVPISSTLTTCLKIENAFLNSCKNKQKEDTRFSVFQPFYSVVIVGDGKEDSMEKKVKDKNSLVSTFWDGFNKEDRIILTKNREIEINNSNAETKVKDNGERKNQYNVFVKSKWNKVEDCELCFPDNPLDERPLFGTDKVTVTPSLIFNPPITRKIESKESRIKFFVGNKKNYNYPFLDKSMINEVHYERFSKHFRYYLNYQDIIYGNRDNIKRWVVEVRKGKDFPSNKVLLIAPDKAENGEFVHLINEIVFEEKANIIKVDPKFEHPGNLDKFFSDDIKDKDIYFVDNLIANGKTLNKVFETLSIIINADSKKNTDLIKGVFTLINRLDLADINNLRINKDLIYSFMSFNVPLIPERNCPMCDARDNYEKLAKDSSLDIVRQYFYFRELPKFTAQKKYEIKQPTPNEEKRDSRVLKFALIHFLNQFFANCTECKNEKIGDCENHSKEDFCKVISILRNGKIQSIEKYNFNKFIDVLKLSIGNISQFEEIEDKTISDIKLKSNIIKILCEYPFKSHRGIKIAAFYWVLKDLIEITDNIRSQELDKSEDDKKAFSIWRKINTTLDNKEFDDLTYLFNYLRCLIKYGSILQTSFLLHQNFINAILIIINSEFFSKWTPNRTNEAKKMYYSKKNFKIYCTAHIQKSLVNVEARSIKFENNINELWKQNNQLDDKSILELLQLENTKLIKQLVDADIPIDNINNLDEELLKSYSSYNNFKSFRGENNVKLIRDLLKLKKNLNVSNYQSSNNENKFITEPDFEGNAKELTKNVAKILGYNIEDKSNGGGFFIYTYQNESPQIITMGEVGDTRLAELCQSDCLNNQAIVKDILQGKTYLDDGDVRYTLTNYSILKNGDEWLGQESNLKNEIKKQDQNQETFSDYNNCPEIKEIEKVGATRLLLYRIADIGINNSNKETSVENFQKGHALFAFYDNEKESIVNKKYQRHCIDQLRYVNVFRNRIINYFQKNYDNDSFRAWVNKMDKLKISENAQKRYEKAFHNFDHKVVDKVKEQWIYLENSYGKDNGIISTAYQVGANIINSHFYASLVKNNKVSPLNWDVKEIQTEKILPDYFKLILKDIVRKLFNVELKIQLSEKQNLEIGKFTLRAFIVLFILNIKNHTEHNFCESITLEVNESFLQVTNFVRKRYTEAEIAEFKEKKRLINTFCLDKLESTTLITIKKYCEDKSLKLNLDFDLNGNMFYIKVYGNE